MSFEVALQVPAGQLHFEAVVVAVFKGLVGQQLSHAAAFQGLGHAGVLQVQGRLVQSRKKKESSQFKLKLI